MIKKTASAGCRLMCAAMLTGAAIGSWQHAPRAHAAVASRGDPLFTIVVPTPWWSPTTTKLQVVSTIAADSTQVQRITYALDAPVGSVVTNVVYTGGSLAGKESYTLTADRTDSTIVAVTTASTTGAAAPVTVSATNLTTGFQASASGMSNQSITASVRLFW